MRISDWSSDVCSSDLQRGDGGTRFCALSAFRLNAFDRVAHFLRAFLMENLSADDARAQSDDAREQGPASNGIGTIVHATYYLQESPRAPARAHRSEEHTSELQSLMRISYAVCCLKKQKNTHNTTVTHYLAR